VTGVEVAGQEFMQTVFGLTPGEVGVAKNHPETIVYVVRVTEFSPPYNELFDKFKREPIDKYISTGMFDLQPVTSSWRENIKKSAGLKWIDQESSEPASEPASPPEPEEDDGGGGGF
jgi:hypothetical protein